MLFFCLRKCFIPPKKQINRGVLGVTAGCVFFQEAKEINEEGNSQN